MSAPNAAPHGNDPRTELGWLRPLLTHPNAIWLREVRQAARLDRTPWLLGGITLMLALFVAAIGGVASTGSLSPAKVGMALNQVFFSLAYVVVMLVGPAVAANAVAGEREGRTWEALLLTGMTPAQIARGKFLSAYTTLSLYIMAIAPVGALSFVFGGTTATETVVGFILLFMLAALWVAFGLAISAAMRSLRGAFVIALILAILIGPVLYTVFGSGFATLAHEHWRELPAGLPIWLPVAYTRASFGVDYVVLLVALPIVVLALPAWFLYEATIANLSASTDDRSSGLKRWFIVSTLALTGLAAAIPASLSGGGRRPLANPAFIASELGLWTLSTFFGFAALLFIGEPAGPSRRLTISWTSKGTGALARALGPGLARTFALVMLLETAAFAAATGGAILAMVLIHKSGTIEAVGLSGALLWAHALFFTGLCAWVRSRNDSVFGARVIALAIAVALTFIPWGLAAVGGIATRQTEWLAVGAPSKFYVLVVLAQLAEVRPPDPFLMTVAYVAVPLIAALGMVLFALAVPRAHAINVATARHYALMDAALAHEDAAAPAP
jgi:hypothetical protein